MEKMAIDSPMDTSVALAPAAPPSRLPVTIPVTSGNESDSSHGGGSGSMTRPLAFRQRAPLILTTQASDDDFDDLETRSNISTSTLGDASDRSSGGRIGRGLLLRRNGSETPSIRLPNLSQLSSSMPSLSTASRDDITSSNSGLNDNDTAAAGPPLRKLSIGISDSNMAGVKQGGNGRPLRPTPSLSQLSTGGGMSKRPRNAKNLSLMVPMNRSYHSAPNSPPGTPGGSHPGLLSMMMARRDETMPEDEQERGPLTGGRSMLSSLKPRGSSGADSRHRSYSDTPLRPHTAFTEEHREQSLVANDPYREGPVCILPNLYLGTEVNAANQEQLRKLNIRYILNVAKEVPVPYTDDMLLLSPRSERTAAAIKAAEDLRQNLIIPGLSVPAPPPRAYFVHPKAHPWHGVAAPNLLSVTTSIGPMLQSRSLPLDDEIDVDSLLGNSSAGSNSSSNGQVDSGNSSNSGNESIVVGVDKPLKRPNVGSDTWNRMAGRAFEERFRYKKFNWGHNQEDLVEFFENAFSFIDQGRSRGEGVLVHCQCGVSRSASLVLAYVMRNQSMPLHEAYAYVKERSAAISPNMSLFYQLVEFERKLGLSRQYPGEEEEEEEVARTEELRKTNNTKMIAKSSGGTNTAALIGLTTENSPSLMSITTAGATANNKDLKSFGLFSNNNNNSGNLQMGTATATANGVAGIAGPSSRERRNSIWRSVSAQHARALSTVIEDIAESQLSPIASPRTPCEACDEDTMNLTQKFYSRRVLAK